LEILEFRHLLAGDFHNAANPADVNASGYISLVDTIAIVTDLRTFGVPHDLVANPPAGPGQFLDVVNNELVDIADLLATIGPQREGLGAPAPELEAMLENPGAEGETSNPRILGQITGGLTGGSRVVGRIGTRPWFDVDVNVDGEFSFIAPLPLDGSADGPHTLELFVQNFGGPFASVEVPFILRAFTPGIASISPAHGEEMVNVTRETIVRFDGKVDPDTVTTESFYLIANGERIPGRVHVSSTNEFATFFYDDPLPPSTGVRVVVDGEQIALEDGRKLDADGDRQPGGLAQADFRTLPLARVPGTNVWGFLKDAYTGEPIVGATIRVDGFPEANAVTDSDGRYDLFDMPAPMFFVHLDGSTATNLPPGFIYPNVGKPFPSVPGETIQMGMNGVPMDLFLPPVAVNDITPLSPDEETEVSFGAEGLGELSAMFPEIDPAVWARTHVMIAPGAATDDDGNAATQAVVVPVPPDRLPGPLPPGMDPELVISIQPLGATNFDVPAPVTFPNLEGLAPGEKSLIFSFNHDSGQWDVAGAGTVSEDGLMIASDPGAGIRAPGWHFVQFASAAASDPCNNYCTAAQFQDFLVGPGQPPITFEIVTNPPASTVRWTITPVGSQSGTVADNQGTSKQVSFTPDVTGVRPISGSRSPNPAVEYRVTYSVTSPDGTVFNDTVTIRQNIRAQLRQEYVDYGLSVPFIGEVAPARSTENFQGAEFSGNSNYSPWVVNGGMQEIAQSIRTQFGQPITVTSAFRNPQRNEEVGGVGNSVHMSGGAVDMAPGGSGTMVQLYRAALAVGPGLVLLERNAQQLLPGNWAPPPASHTFTAGGASITVSDASGDGLPDQVQQIANAPPSGVASNTNLAYDGGAAAKPNFRVLDSNGNGKIDAAEPLVLNHNGLTPLVQYFQNATHVHADNRRLVGGGEGDDAGNESSALGFGNDSRLYYRFEFDTGAILAGRSNAAGVVQAVLPPGRPYTLTVYVAATNRWAQFTGVSSASGVATPLGPMILDHFGGADADNDGLPDMGELAIGTAANEADTDDDGIDDAAEITQGLDPLDDRGFPTGIIASLPLRGPAQDIVVEGSSAGVKQQTAYVATGNDGLAIVDVSRFNNPIVLGQLQLPGFNQDVSVDSELQIAAVAAGPGGLHLVDISDPMAPAILQSVTVDASQVEVFDGLAYVTAGNQLRAFDLLTGERVDVLTVPGFGPFQLAREGSRFYLADTSYGSSTLSVVDVNSGRAEVVGQLNVPATEVVRLFAANGVAFLSGNNPQALVAVDVSDPSAMQVLSAPAFVNPAAGLALNGSGLALVGTPIGGGGISIFDVSDLQNIDSLLLVAPTPGSSLGIAIASGVAFVADDEAGLQVVNYLPFDANGQAPTVSIAAGVDDQDPNAPGIQVVEGTSIPVRAAVADDVQVRNVELIVDGQAVRNDVSYPFDFSAFAVRGAPNATSVNVQVRATDTGGNSTLSTPLAFQLVPDTFAPNIVKTIPADGDTKKVGLQRIEIEFSEPMAAATLSPANFRLRDDNDVELPLRNLQLRGDGRIVQLAYDPLSSGDYTFTIDAASATDRAGNPLGGGVVTSSFRLAEFRNVWTGAVNESWDNPGNWSAGKVPGPLDDVVIDKEGTYAVELNANAAVDSITLGTGSGSQSLHTNGFGLVVNRLIDIKPSGHLLVDRFLTIPEGGEVRGAGEVRFLAGASVIDGLFSAANATLASGTIEFNGTATLGNLVQTGGTLEGTGAVTVTEQFDWSGGIQQGAGVTRIAAGAALRHTGETRLIARTIENFGTVTFGDAASQSSNLLWVKSGAILRNTMSGTLDVQSFLHIDPEEGNVGTNVIVNQGLFRVSSGDGAVLYAQLDNSGVVEVATSLSLYGGGSSVGNFSIQAGGELMFGDQTYTFSPGATLNNDGVLWFNGGAANINGDFDVPGQVNLINGVVWNVAGVTTISGSVDVHYAFFQGSGITRIAAGGVLNNQVLTIIVGHTLENAGTINMVLADGYPPPTLLLGSGGILRNLPTGTVDIQASTTFDAHDVGAGMIENLGTFRQSTPDPSSIQVRLDNSGTVDIQSGMVEIHGSGTATGDFIVAEGATLEFADSYLLSPTATISGAGDVKAAGSVLRIEIAGANPGQFAQIHVTGTATLQGILEIEFVGGFVPLPNDLFRILDFASLVGAFDSVTVLNSGIGVIPEYNSDNLTLRVI
jgi:hypothetical protein